MVRFDGDKVVIEISGYGNPTETWSDIVVGLVDVLGALDKDMINTEEIRGVTLLLKEMMPEWETVKRMR